jgi:hypothetical protein
VDFLELVKYIVGPLCPQITKFMKFFALYISDFLCLADCFNSQVAGLTNNSYLSESHEVRHCVQQYKILGEQVLQVAKVRQIAF